MRTAFPAMGTVVSIATEADVPHRVLNAVRQIFADHDEAFSLYRPSSPLSAMARGELTLEAAPESLREEYARALEWRTRTHGWFTPHRPDGVIDLSGTIKAVATDAARGLLADAGASGLLGAGGDIVAFGEGVHPVGIVDPRARTRLLADLRLPSGRAVATSGSAERGDHIWSRLGRTDVVQVSVITDDIVTADVLATALVAAGTAGIDELLDAFDVDALIVTANGLLATPRWPRSAAAAVPGGVGAGAEAA
jgi:thiamine biosynthesis lipoprotein